MIVRGKGVLCIAKRALDPFLIIAGSFHQSQVTFLYARLANGMIASAARNGGAVATVGVRRETDNLTTAARQFVVVKDRRRGRSRIIGVRGGR
jgi:hypothetical protein